MANIDFSMTYLALKMFGKQLYANISAAIAELVANGLDANAQNVYVYMDIKDKSNATIAIFDDGDGMDEETLRDQYAVIGRNKRGNLSPEEASKIMGRKGIGKLAALYLSNTYYIISQQEAMNSPRAWKLDVSNMKDDDSNPQLIEVAYPMAIDDVFGADLISTHKGTIILLKNVKIKNFGEAAELALEQKLANYFLTTNLSQKIKLCIIRSENQPTEFIDVEKDIAYKNMAVIYTTDTKAFEVLRDNTILIRDKRLPIADNVFKTTREIIQIPDNIDATVKDEKGKSIKVTNPIIGNIEIEGKTYPYKFKGWIGVHSTIEQEDSKLNCDNFKKNMHYNPNQLRIYVRNKLATSEFLNNLGLTAAFLNYIEGEIEFDVLDVEDLEDIATAGRDNFSVQDERVKKLVELCKGLVNKLVGKRQGIADEMSAFRKQVEEGIKEQERQEIKTRFRKGAIKSKRVFENMPKEDQEAVEDDFVQFSRAANLSRPTKRILISHKKDCEQFGNFIIDILLKMSCELKENIIFTSNSDYGVPQGYDICTYLNECFRDDIYVVFLFSRSYYDSNICLAEAGAAWGTNKQYTNFVIDMSFNDISEPINSGQKGARLINLTEDDKKDLAKELIRIVQTVGIEKQFHVDEIVQIINNTLSDYGSKLSAPPYLPYRKFQAVPVCGNCKHMMELQNNESVLEYVCECGTNPIATKIK